MKRWISCVAAIVALAVMPVVATASDGQSQEGQNDGQDQGEGTVHFGPIASGSPDSGTCGPDWANDTYNRDFFAASTPTNGTYSVTEFFNQGRFVTMAGRSPGACNTATDTHGMIIAGVRGSFGGSFGIVVSGGTFNPNALCDQATCGTTKAFVATVYGAGATYDIPTFEFTYNARGEDLLQRMWHNASPDRGGNYGDIRSS
ncbi:MAG TPA: hypothetical protein VFH00_05250 [Candidatus Nitrosotalea sp.]|nr:hypothetical protein [Candidatus Nitrosotalea sp.]